MGSLVHHITAVSAARYGVNILEQAPPGGVRGVGTNLVGVVADLPWGPVNQVVELSSNAELFDTFAPLPFDALGDAPALKAFINKTFPNTVKVVRIAASGQVTAAVTFPDADGADSVVVTARYPGALGNAVEVAWSANADDATVRDATVRIGTTYARTYAGVAAPYLAGGVVVADPGDPYVAFSAADGAVGVPEAIEATPLAGGADGEAIGSDYTGDTNEGLRAFYDANVAVDVVFVAEPPDDLVDAINAGLLAYVADNEKGMAVLCTPADQDKATAQAYVAAYRWDRLVYPWPRVKTVDTFDAERPEVGVQGNSFVAAAIASVAPERSPGGAPGARYLRGITGLEQSGITAADYANLNAAGVAPFFHLTAVSGFIVHRGVTTSITPGREKIFRKRMTDFIVGSLAEVAERYVEEPLDLDLANQALGPVTGPEFKEFEAFLRRLKDGGRIRDVEIDAFGGNTQTNIDAGQWIILVAVKLLSMQEEIILQALVGERVQIQPVA